MSKRKFSFSMGGKGYYIALILCAVAIGISGYLYYRNANQDTPVPDADVSVVGTDGAGAGEVPAVGTQPDLEPTEATQPSGTTAPVTTKPIKTVSPVEGQVVAAYAMDALAYNATTRDWRVHNGMDIAAEEGTKVNAAAAGTVYTVYEDETMGTTVVIRHDGGYVTKYSSLAEDVSVKAGDTVTMGQQIGCVGQTALLESAIGCHVHFSVSCNDKTVDPGEFLSLE